MKQSYLRVRAGLCVLISSFLVELAAAGSVADVDTTLPVTVDISPTILSLISLYLLSLMLVDNFSISDELFSYR